MALEQPKSAFQPISIELSEEQEEALCRQVLEELRPALEEHRLRAETYARWYRAYKAQPEVDKKTFPWPGASNVVVPLCAIAVDTIQSRLQRAVFGAKEMFEVDINDPQFEPLKKDIRDWANLYVRKYNKGALRDIFFDMPQYGDAYIKLLWEDSSREAHFYDPTGNVMQVTIPEFTGVRWHVIAPSDIVYPAGFERWADLPWVDNIIRYTWRELKKQEKLGYFHDVDRVRGAARPRQDSFFRAQQEAAGLPQQGFAFHETHEIWGSFEVPVMGMGMGTSVGPQVQVSEDPDGLEYQEVILTLVLEPTPMLLRAIYNPFFGRARQIVKFPFIHQPHEIAGQGTTDVTLQFQESASASHNQVIDAGTVANASIIVTRPDANFGDREDIFPGKHITTENPREDIATYPMGSGNSSVLGSMEQKAVYYAEKRNGVSAYNMGMESPIVGSRATATGTTALISEGNIRFWVSIDDMRSAIEELMYLTIQQEQQFRPEGTPITASRMLTWPQADVRSSMGLRLAVSSEQINRDLEIQNLQLLMTVLNEYYARFMQAGAMILNPGFPPAQKMLAVQVMNASHEVLKKFIERFDIENIDSVLPNIMQALGQAMETLNGLGVPNAGAPMGGVNPAGVSMAPPAAGAGNIGGPVGSSNGPGALPAPGGR